MARTVQKKSSKVTTKKKAVKTPAKKTAVKKNAAPATKKITVKKAAPVAKKVAVKKNAAPVAKAPIAKKATVKKAAPVAKSPVAKKVAVKKNAAPVAKKVAVKKNVAPVAKAPVAKKVEVKKTVVPAAKAPVHKKEEVLKKLRLSKTDKKYFHDLLIHARAQFGQQVRFHSEDALSSHKDSAGERAGMATHMADLGTDNYRHDYELQLMTEEVDVLEMIDEALLRLEDSEYGICLDCGEQIPRKRLEAKPYAKYCTKCKSKREAMDDFTHRR